MAKIELRKKAIDLAKGKTYSEILKDIPVAKSTLSLWLRWVGLSVRQKTKDYCEKKACSNERSKRP